jgi:hypothetical protein
MARYNFSQSGTIQAFNRQTGLRGTYQAMTGFTGFQWSNTGREIVAIINGATASNYTINIGTTIEGQAVTAIGPTPLPVSNTDPIFFGPFNRDFQQNDGANSIYIDLSSVATVTVAVFQMPGAF